MSPESRMMNPGNARPFLNHYSLFIVRYSLFIINYSLFHCSSLFTLHSSLFDCSSLFILHYSLFIYIGKVTLPVSAHVDI